MAHMLKAEIFYLVVLTMALMTVQVAIGKEEKGIMIQWRFTTNDARKKLKRHYETVRN